MKFQEWESKEIAEGRINKGKTQILEIPNYLEFENDELKITDY